MQYIHINLTITERNSAFLKSVAEEFTGRTGMGFNLSRYIQELLNDKETAYNAIPN